MPNQTLRSGFPTAADGQKGPQNETAGEGFEALAGGKFETAGRAISGNVYSPEAPCPASIPSPEVSGRVAAVVAYKGRLYAVGAFVSAETSV